MLTHKHIEKFDSNKVQSEFEKAKEFNLSKTPLLRTAITRLEDATKQPKIKKIMGEVWQYNELHIHFADTGVGKSIFAMALANAISKGENFMHFENENPPLPVLYYDFELSDIQLLKRYSNDNENIYQFSPLLYIDNIDFAELISSNPNAKFIDLLFSKIRADIKETDAKVIVIDNSTYLNTQSTQDTQIALEVMRELNNLKKEFGISILVLSHTPKRNISTPISLNDLAGSKHLSNFADSVSSIGRCAHDKNIRYFKQVKPSRSGELIYDTENVITCKIVKNDTFLTFEFIDFTNEYEHLKQPSENERVERKREQTELAKKLKSEGKSYSQISLELFGKETSKSSVHELLKK
jgi:RecA-family ATPase